MRMDVLLNEAGDDLGVSPAGDFLVGPSAQQEVMLLLESEKGEWRQFPAVGAGIRKYIRKVAGNTPRVDNVNRLIREIKVTLQADGFSSPEVSIKPDLSDFSVTVEP
jgi:hypothetical protein